MSILDGYKQKSSLYKKVNAVATVDLQKQKTHVAPAKSMTEDVFLISFLLYAFALRCVHKAN